MRVWIDQDLCTGDGLCVELAPPVFMLDDDGLAYVLTPAGEQLRGAQQADVPPELEEATIEAAEECPGTCIFIEDDDRAPYTPDTYK